MIAHQSADRASRLGRAPVVGLLLIVQVGQTFAGMLHPPCLMPVE
jgi:hypothetical protein